MRVEVIFDNCECGRCDGEHKWSIHPQIVQEFLEATRTVNSFAVGFRSLAGKEEDHASG